MLLLCKKNLPTRFVHQSIDNPAISGAYQDAQKNGPLYKETEQKMQAELLDTAKMEGRLKTMNPEAAIKDAKAELGKIKQAALAKMPQMLADNPVKILFNNLENEYAEQIDNNLEVYKKTADNISKLTDFSAEKVTIGTELAKYNKEYIDRMGDSLTIDADSIINNNFDTTLGAISQNITELNAIYQRAVEVRGKVSDIPPFSDPTLNTKLTSNKDGLFANMDTTSGMIKSLQAKKDKLTGEYNKQLPALILSAQSRLEELRQFSGTMQQKYKNDPTGLKEFGQPAYEAFIEQKNLLSNLQLRSLQGNNNQSAGSPPAAVPAA